MPEQEIYTTHYSFRQRHGREYETTPCPEECLGSLIIEDQLGERLALACNGDGCSFTVSVPAQREIPAPDSRTESGPF